MYSKNLDAYSIILWCTCIYYLENLDVFLKKVHLYANHFYVLSIILWFIFENHCVYSKNLDERAIIAFWVIWCSGVRLSGGTIFISSKKGKYPNRNYSEISNNCRVVTNWKHQRIIQKRCWKYQNTDRICDPESDLRKN